jgi:cell wall-associated NlpC family hydrolase
MAFWYSRIGWLGGVATAGALILPATGAQAAPRPEKELTRLNSTIDALVNQYDKASTELAAAKKRYKVLNGQLAEEQRVYDGLHLRVAQLAVEAYKTGAPDSSVTMLVSKDPAAALVQMSAFTALSNNRSQELKAFLDSTQRLRRDHAAAQATLDDLTRRTKALKQQGVGVRKSIAKQQALLRKHGDPVDSTDPGGGRTYNGPASGPARKAVQYAFAQLGKPYIFGGTGPRGYDCSGLTMMSWRAAGVNLPRIVPDQYHASKHVAKADLQPGDLVYFDGLGHEGIYIGKGKFIHAPHTGTVVQIASLSNPWYTSHYVGASRP